MVNESTRIADDLRVAAERIGDEAMALLRRALRADTPEEQAELRRTEKQLTRARRSVEKAISLLDGTEPEE